MQKSVKIAQNNKNLSSLYEFQTDLAKAILLLEKRFDKLASELGWLIRIRHRLKTIFS